MCTCLQSRSSSRDHRRSQSRSRTSKTPLNTHADMYSDIPEVSGEWRAFTVHVAVWGLLKLHTARAGGDGEVDETVHDSRGKEGGGKGGGGDE